MTYQHIPVMLREVIKNLNVKEGQNYIDCTLGGAGYTIEIAKKVGPTGKVVALDMDKEAIKNAKKKIKEESLNNIELVRENFKNIDKVASKHFAKGEEISGVVLDLGLSSFQLSDKSRGFSFQHDAPLNMAFGEQAENRTEEIINEYSLEDLTDIFQEYGEEKHAYRIAKEIVFKRRKKKILTTTELAEIVKEAYPARSYHKIHPATKVFQALRMETNQEIENLKEVLPAATSLLKFKGRLVVVSFHSGEDRVVKRFFKDSEDLMAITKRPLVPREDEVKNNPRSRSAKLRAAIKINEETF